MAMASNMPDDLDLRESADTVNSFDYENAS